jgi:hypothetical protein
MNTNRPRQDFAAFYEAHFSQNATEQFRATFLQPPEAQEQPRDHLDEWEEDAGLGYYEDGVKRTLTDEQIDIFRHSELEALRRNNEKGSTPISSHDVSGTDSGGQNNHFKNGSKVKKSNKKGGNRRKTEPKPDLRKRTWDVVETGLDSLEYD